MVLARQFRPLAHRVPAISRGSAATSLVPAAQARSSSSATATPGTVSSQAGLLNVLVAVPGVTSRHSPGQVPSLECGTPEALIAELRGPGGPDRGNPHGRAATGSVIPDSCVSGEYVRIRDHGNEPPIKRSDHGNRHQPAGPPTSPASYFSPRPRGQVNPRASRPGGSGRQRVTAARQQLTLMHHTTRARPGTSPGPAFRWRS